MVTTTTTVNPKFDHDKKGQSCLCVSFVSRVVTLPKRYQMGLDTTVRARALSLSTIARSKISSRSGPNKTGNALLLQDQPSVEISLPLLLYIETLW